MSKKIIFAVSQEGGTEVVRFADLADFNDARKHFATAADYMARRGWDLDPYDLELFIWSGLKAMPGEHEYTEQIYAAWLYLNKCLKDDNEPYLPYIQNAILDFLEIPYITNNSGDVPFDIFNV